MHLHAAAQHLQEVGDDLALEDLGVVGLEAVEDFTPDGHDALELRVPGELDAAQSRVALHDVELPAGGVLRPAVHKLLYPVGDVHTAGELFLDVQPGALGVLPAALVDEHLLGDLPRVQGILNEVDLQLGPQKLGHGLLDKLVVDGLLGLVLVGGLGGEVVAHQHQAVLHVGPGDLALALLVFALGLEVGVDAIHEGGLHRLLRGAAVLQPGGVVVVLDDLHRVGEAKGDGELHLVLGLVRPVPAPPLGLPEHGQGEGVLPRQLLHIVLNAVFVLEVGGLELPPHLVAEAEGDPGVDHRLALEHVGVVLHGDVDVGKHVQIRLPAEAGAGLFAGVGLLFQAAHVLALLEVEGVLKAVPVDHRIKVRAGVLGGAGAQAVEAQGVLVVVAVVVVVLAAGVQLAEHQLPVELLLLLVPVHRAAPAEVLHLDGVILIPGDGDQGAVALPGLVDGVGQDLKDRVLTALQPVGAEDHRRALAYPVGPLQGGNGVVSVIFGGIAFRHGPLLARSKIRKLHLIILLQTGPKCQENAKGRRTLSGGLSAPDPASSRGGRLCLDSLRFLSPFARG